MQHPDEGTIHAWLDGQLPVEEAAAIESHVSECAECSAVVAEARGLIAASSRIVSALDAVPAGVIPIRKPVRRPWYASTQLRAAAAVLFVAGASMLVARERGGEPVQETSARVADMPAATEPAATEPAATGSAANAPPANAPVADGAAGSSQAAAAPVTAQTEAPLSLRTRPVERASARGAGTDTRGEMRNQAQPGMRDEARESSERAAAANAPAAAAPAPAPAAVSAQSDADRRARFGSVARADAVVTGVAAATVAEEMKVVRADTMGITKVIVYKAPDGLEVTLTEMPPQPPTLAPARAEDMQQKQLAAPPPARVRTGTAATAAGAAKAAPIASINWIDSTTKRVYILSGPTSIERLEQLRREIERAKRKED